jgi:hypothetical protein
MKASLFTFVSLILGAVKLAVACPQMTTSATCDAVQQAEPAVAVQSFAVPSVAVLASPNVVTPTVITPTVVTSATVLATPTFVTPTLITPTVVVNQVVNHRMKARARVQITRVRVR